MCLYLYKHFFIFYSLTLLDLLFEVLCMYVCYLLFPINNNNYRAMHFSAKRGIAIACRLSVRLSSVCDVGEL